MGYFVLCRKGKSMGKRIEWRPYIAGALVGVVAILSVYVSTKVLDKPKYLGASTTFVRAAGLVEKELAPGHVEANAYFKKTGVKIDWQFMLVVGIFIGALVSSLADGSFKLESVPSIWRERFGNSKIKRGVGALLGGVVAMFGARMAGGCPSGHGLSGLMQMSISGFIALACFFGAGVVVATMVYRGKRGAK
jgi:uncharacterized membrane protein YedE/YeeE